MWLCLYMLIAAVTCRLMVVLPGVNYRMRTVPISTAFAVLMLSLLWPFYWLAVTCDYFRGEE